MKQTREEMRLHFFHVIDQLHQELKSDGVKGDMEAEKRLMQAISVVDELKAKVCLNDDRH